MDANHIGAMIRYHRKISGLSRVDCARLAGAGKTAIYDIEHGKETVQLATLLKILKVLNIDMEFSSPLMDQFEASQNEKG